MPPAEYENTEIKTDVDSNIFLTKGKVLKSKGYLEVYKKEEKDDLLPSVDVNDIVEVLEIKPLTKQTTPPKPYTEDTLLKAMKNCAKNVPDDDTTVLSGYSIGTSATRADVLKKISQVGYVGKKGKSYFITDLGKNLVEIFTVKELFDVDYINNIMTFIFNNVELIKRDTPKNISTETYSYNPKTKKFSKESSIKSKSSTSKENKANNESLGKCPICQNDVVEIEKGFICKNYSECKFGIWKNDKFLEYYKKKPNKTMVKSILKNGSAKVKSLTSKQGKKFNATLRYSKKDNGYFGWDLEI